MQVLKGHTSEETAYLIEDYPYGFRLRCKMKAWLETQPKKGVRFVTQTENPKNGRWNNPKASTYAKICGAMFLDEKGHVQWECVTEYTDEQKCLEFVEKYGSNDSLKEWARCQVKYHSDKLAGKKFFTINGEKQEDTEHEKELLRREMEIWQKVYEA